MKEDNSKCEENLTQGYERFSFIYKKWKKTLKFSFPVVSTNMKRIQVGPTKDKTEIYKLTLGNYNT